MEALELSGAYMANLSDGFKMTELGPLPEEWRVVRLGEVAEMKLGRTPPRKEQKKYWQQGVVPWVSIADLNNGVVRRSKELVSKEAFREIFNEQLVPEGTLLFSFKLTIGKVGILGIPAVHNEAIVSLFPYDNVATRDFLFFLLQSLDYDAFLDAYVKGKTLNKGKLHALPIPLPPLPEQRAIAHVLRTVQRAKEATERVIAALKELKKSLMRHLFTYGPVPVDQANQVPLKETEIGPLPEGWEVVRLGEVVELMRNGLTKEQNKDGIGLPVTRIETISSGTINPARVGFVSREKISEQEIERYRLKNGDILFSHINSEPEIGKSAVYRGTPSLLLHGMNLLLIRTSKDVCDPEFLNYLFNQYRRQGIFVALSARAVGQSSINQGKMKNLSIPLPPLPEQRAIADALRTLDRKIEAEEQRKAALEALFKTLLHQLMTGKVRVKDLQVSEVEERHEPR